MEPIELAPESIEAIARRVAELLDGGRAGARASEPVPLLPIAVPRKPKRKPAGRLRDDLAEGLQGTPFGRNR